MKTLLASLSLVTLLAVPVVAAVAEERLEELAAITRSLGSPDVEQRRAALARFTRGGPDRFGSSAWEVILLALADPDPEVLWRCLQAASATVDSDPGLGAAEILHRAGDLLESEDDEVAAAAAAALARLQPKDPEVELRILERLRSAGDGQWDMVRAIAAGGVSPAVRQDLLGAAKGAAEPATRKAIAEMLLLTRWDDPPAELLPVLVELVESEIYLGDANTIASLDRYPRSAVVPYLGRLRELVEQVRSELELCEDPCSQPAQVSARSLDALRALVARLEEPEP